ncbi:zinc finger BED domain-containing protein RICESLEEPER 2-like protein [Tanacetum coccineum]
MPSRWTVARDCLSLFQEEKIKLKKLLKNQTVCLTTDTWTSVQNYNYMCLTAHWIDEKWNLKKKILNFCQIANHKGVTIGKLVYRCLQDWGIDRVFTITVDNASSNDGAIKFLKTLLKGPNSVLDCKYLHLRCCAHIINLVVREGLEEHITSVDKIRNAVRYLRSSPGRLTSFEESVEFEKIDCGRKPCLDVDTRWNSTFLMLNLAKIELGELRTSPRVPAHFDYRNMTLLQTLDLTVHNLDGFFNEIQFVVNLDLVHQPCISSISRREKYYEPYSTSLEVLDDKQRFLLWQ